MSSLVMYIGTSCCVVPKVPQMSVFIFLFSEQKKNNAEKEKPKKPYV